jgi:hypothetical protein
MVYSFQNVQLINVIGTSLRFLPNVIIGIILNACTGLLVHRFRADHIVLVTSVVSGVSPLLMAVINPNWPWWYCAFWGVLLSPLSADGKHLITCTFLHCIPKQYAYLRMSVYSNFYSGESHHHRCISSHNTSTSRGGIQHCLAVRYFNRYCRYSNNISKRHEKFEVHNEKLT